MLKKSLGLVFLVIIFHYIFYSYRLAEKIVNNISSDLIVATKLQKRGIDVSAYYTLNKKLEGEVKSRGFLVSPFLKPMYESARLAALQDLTTQYQIALTMKRNDLNSKLNFFRERIKENEILSDYEKREYSNEVERIASFAFELTDSLVDIATSEALLDDVSEKVTIYSNSKKKGILFSDLQRYISTCELLKTFFSEHNLTDYSMKASVCIENGKNLFKASNTLSALESEIYDNVYVQVSELNNIKLQTEQEEKQKSIEQERKKTILTYVPSAPLPIGKVVVVDIALQRLYAYENSYPIFQFAVPITSGKKGFETIRGEFAVYDKQRNFRMLSPFSTEYYDTIVDYWMPFYLGYGLHNAPWRNVYGMQDYLQVGSHGCINIPYNETVALYNWVDIGTKVIVQ